MKTIDFNADWLFQKIGEDAVPVRLPHDAMLTEVRTEDCHNGEKTGYFPGGKYIYQKDFWLDRQREDGVLELLQNNVSLGVKKLKDFRASFTTTYKAGSLKAIARSADGSQIGESLLSTGQKETILKVKPEKETLFATGQDLCYVPIEFTDFNGCLKPMYEQPVHIKVEGAASLAGFGSSVTKTDRRYDQTTAVSHQGRVLAVLRSGIKPGTVTITVESRNMKPVTVTLDVMSLVCATYS